MMLDDEGNLLPSIGEAELTAAQEKLLHRTIKKVGDDIESMNFNTAIAQMMIFVNEFLSLERKSRAAMETFTLLLAPFAPHIAEELWSKFGHAGSLSHAKWPKFDHDKIREETVELVVQINGKVRAKLAVPVNLAEDEVKELVLNGDGVRKYLEGKTIDKVVVVKNRIVSLVVR